MSENRNNEKTEVRRGRGGFGTPPEAYYRRKKEEKKFSREMILAEHWVRRHVHGHRCWDEKNPSVFLDMDSALYFVERTSRCGRVADYGLRNGLPTVTVEKEFEEVVGHSPYGNNMYCVRVVKYEYDDKIITAYPYFP